MGGDQNATAKITASAISKTAKYLNSEYIMGFNSEYSMVTSNG